MNQLAIGILLADGPVNTGPDFGKASPVGLVIVVVLLIAVLLLGWSMNRQLKKVPKSFDETETVTGAASEDGTESTGGESHG
jgi:di/tricarboxylate transporter